jgi:hypothetical protein
MSTTVPVSRAPQQFLSRTNANLSTDVPQCPSSPFRLQRSYPTLYRDVSKGKEDNNKRELKVVEEEEKEQGIG